jgi:hypothetical protein
MSQPQERTRRDVARRVGRLLLFVASFVGAFAPMPTTSAAQTICVALVVDFRTLQGPVDSGCTRVPPGSTGYDVLRAGGHTFQVCSNGIIGTIDGKPANGCQIKDDSHFWGYWHRKPGSRTWTFSSYGAAAYHPAEGSTEGWVWENGSTTPPANVPYPAGCHTASTSPSPSPSPRATPAAGGPASSTPAPAAVAGSGPAATTRTPRSGHQRQLAASAPAAASASGASTPRSSATPDGSATGSTTTGGTATPDGGTTPTATDQRNATTTSDAAANHAAPLVAGLAVAVLLAAGAWWRFRRSRSP